MTDSYNNRVPFGTAIGIFVSFLFHSSLDVSLRDSQRGPTNNHYYPQYPPQQPHTPQSSPYGQPYPLHTPSPVVPRPSMAGPGMVPYGTPVDPGNTTCSFSSNFICSPKNATNHQTSRSPR